MDFITKIGFVLSFVGLGIALVLGLAPYVWPKMPHWFSRAGIGLGILLIALGPVLFILLPNQSFPDVKLIFVHPKQPGVMLLNQSAKTAANIKYGGYIANVSAADPRKPLPIPFGTFDFLKPNSSSGLYQIFEQPAVANLIKPGDRLFGYISITCPECERTRIYWVSVLWGDGGWYSELPENHHVDNEWLYRNMPEIKDNHVFMLREIPESLRVNIKELP